MCQYKQLADHFLSVASQFNLGELSTEKQHPLSHDLSALAQKDLPKALRILKRIDSEALQVLPRKVREIEELAQRIKVTLDSGHKIILCGCGSTGRLALTLETLWREKYQGKSIADKVRAFMAGGDVALINSIENFEDYVLFGVKQLFEMGFIDGDLLISCTEGGETPFVIGATETAARLSSNKPCFLYCNPDEVLCQAVRRSRRVIKDRNVIKVNCDVGPMAITGSTRMQASTVLMAVAGISLFNCTTHADISEIVDEFISVYQSTNVAFLEDFIKKESGYYRKGEYLLYDVEPHFGITILTDTTERSPTFSLHPFENSYDKDSPVSLCYIVFPEAKNSSTAWQMLLHREPRTLEWEDIHDITSYDRLKGFDFSKKLLDLRKKRTHNAKHHHFKIYRTKKGVCFELEDTKQVIPIKRNSLFEHLMVKMILNMHSTLVMGRLGRYERNIMTWVRPSNNKLIDRTIRYVDLLLQEEDVYLSYENIAYKCFELMERVPEDSSLVLAVVDAILNKTSRER